MSSLQLMDYDSLAFRQTQSMKFWSQSKSQSSSPSAAYKPIFANYTQTSLNIKTKTKSSEVKTWKQLPYMARSLKGSSLYNHNSTRTGKEFMSNFTNEETDPYLINSPLKGIENETAKKKSSKDHYALLGTFPTQQRVDIISPRSNKEDGMSATLRSSSITRFPKDILKNKEDLEPLASTCINKLPKKNQTINKIIGKMTIVEKDGIKEGAEYLTQPKKNKMENLKINRFFIPKSSSTRASDKKTILFPKATFEEEADMFSPGVESHRKSKRIQKAENDAKDLERLLQTEWTIGEEENHGPYRIKQRINLTRNADRTRKENESQEDQERLQLVKNVDIKMKEIDSAGGRAMTSCGFGGRKNQRFMVRVQSRASSIRESKDKEEDDEEEGIKLNNFCTPKSVGMLSDDNIFNYGMYFKKKYMEKGTSMEMSKDLQSRIKAFENEIKQSVKRLGTAAGKMSTDL